MGYSIFFRVYLDGEMVPLGNGRNLANITYGGKSIDHGENVRYGDYLGSFVLTLEDTAKYTFDRATAYYRTTLESPYKYVLYEFKPYSGDNKYIHQLQAPYGNIQILVYLETVEPEDPEPVDPENPGAKWIDVVDPAGTLSKPDGKLMYTRTPTLVDGRHPTSRKPHHQIRADKGALVEMFSTDRKVTLYPDGIYRAYIELEGQDVQLQSYFYRSTIIEPYNPTKRNSYGDYVPILTEAPTLDYSNLGEMDGHPAPVPDGDVPFVLTGGAWGKEMPAHWSYYTDEAPPLQKGYNYIENLGKNTIVEVVRTDSAFTTIPLLEGDKLSVPDDISHLNIIPIDGHVLSPTHNIKTGFDTNEYRPANQAPEERCLYPITWNGKTTFYMYIGSPQFYESPDPNYRRVVTIDWDSVPDGSIPGNPYNSGGAVPLPPSIEDPWDPTLPDPIVPDPVYPDPDPDPDPEPDPEPEPGPINPDPDPIITHTGVLGFNNVYYIDSKKKLNAISDEIYRSIGYGKGDLKDYIINTIQLPFRIPTAYMTTPTYITLGDYKIMVFTNKVTTDNLKLRIGTITTPRKHNNSNDYINTTTTIHLPYSGYVELEPNYVIGQTINVYYIIDMYTGEATINLTSSFINDKVFYSNKVLVGNIYPYLDTKWNNSTVRNLEQTRSVLQNNVDDPYIEVVRNMQYQPESQFNQEIRTTVDRLLMTTGLVYVHDIELNIDTTREELDRIKSTLASGIIIKAPE